MKKNPVIPFDNQYARLDDSFFVATDPVPVRQPHLIKFNDVLAESLGMVVSELSSDYGAAVFAGNTIPEGAEPLAMAYAGHQFGHYSPQLGDGRAVLLGELADAEGHVFGMQLKGSGRTYFSRGGDGRAALGPVLREYLLSEAMQVLGVPTTRALAVVSTGEEVAREQLLPGGVITRLASSFIRVGSFQFFAASGDVSLVKKLADFVIRQNYYQVADGANRYAEFLQQVVEGQASLIAKWMHFGFIHGVMNTDNMSVACETIDYGPCAFMDAFDHDKVFSSIDRDGRYAYSNQPSIGLWNLTRLAETLLPILVENGVDNPEAAVEVAQDILNKYQPRYQALWLSGMQDKCGLYVLDEKGQEDDSNLINELLDIMSAYEADFSLTFYHLSQLTIMKSEDDSAFLDLFKTGSQPQPNNHQSIDEQAASQPGQLDKWLASWRQRLMQEILNDEQRQIKMREFNPVYIPRNHQVEAAIRAAEDHNDFTVFEELHEVLQHPYQEQQGKERYSLPPQPNEVVSKTFCGT